MLDEYRCWQGTVYFHPVRVKRKAYCNGINVDEQSFPCPSSARYRKLSIILQQDTTIRK